MDYRVGQVLYALSSKQMSVIPIQITERIVRETLNGEEVTYVAISSSGKEIADLKKVKATFYEDPAEVEKVLISNVSSVVQDIVKTSKAKAIEAFGAAVGKEVEPVEQDEDETVPDESEKNVVTLSDGTVANIRIPSSLGG